MKNHVRENVEWCRFRFISALKIGKHGEKPGKMKNRAVYRAK